jgi:hypothetical protein
MIIQFTLVQVPGSLPHPSLLGKVFLAGSILPDPQSFTIFINLPNPDPIAILLNSDSTLLDFMAFSNLHIQQRIILSSPTNNILSFCKRSPSFVLLLSFLCTIRSLLRKSFISSGRTKLRLFPSTSTLDVASISSYNLDKG